MTPVRERCLRALIPGQPALGGSQLCLPKRRFLLTIEPRPAGPLTCAYFACKNFMPAGFGTPKEDTGSRRPVCWSIRNWTRLPLNRFATKR